MIRQKLAFQLQGRPVLLTKSATSSWARRAVCVVRSLATQRQPLTGRVRPSLPFLVQPSSSPTSVRYLSLKRREWIKHEVKLAARYTVGFWGIVGAVLVILFFVRQEELERQYPTPHEWSYRTRYFLRIAKDAQDPEDGDIQWPDVLAGARDALRRLSNLRIDGLGVVRLTKEMDPDLEVDPFEFVPADITAKSEEWNRGYFDVLMAAAKASEHLDGWVLDVSRNMVSPPKFMIGPSNPNPKPIPAGAQHAPLEENCVSAFPSAQRWYNKILDTKGFMPRQRIEAALEYASFMEFKGQADAARALHQMALKEATWNLDPSKLPYDPKTLVLKKDAAPPSLNVLDTLTVVANFKARAGDVAGALPMYISLLQARRALSNEPPRKRHGRPRPPDSLWKQTKDLFKPPAYPPRPLSGMKPPWRSPEERCHEASLQLYIGEILYATAAKDDGLAWTRDGVDLAEEQLRSLGPRRADEDLATKATRKLCRECLKTGLGNWQSMVSMLAEAEKTRPLESAVVSKKPAFFWSGGSGDGGARDPEGRWAAEVAVVEERMRRTQDITDDIVPPKGVIHEIFQGLKDF